MCPLSGREKARLLASKDTVERLRTVVGYLSDATARRVTSVAADSIAASVEGAGDNVSTTDAEVPRRRRNARRQPVRRLREAAIAGQSARGEGSNLSATEGVDMETDEDAIGNDDEDEDGEDDVEDDAVAVES